MKLKSKSVLITGGGRGIGEAMAYAFAKEGANISLVARTSLDLEKVQKQLKEFGVKSLVQNCDVSKIKEVENWINTTALEFGKIDVLVNNAGIYGPIGPLVDNDLEQWIQTIEINLLGTVICMKTILPIMMKQRNGVIINISGGGAVSPFPKFSAYSASKAAVVRLTETIAEEVKEYNIRINAISPGAVNTRFLEQVLQAGDAAGNDFLKKSLKQKETGGTSPEVASELAIFLASDESKGLTGRTISAVWDDWKSIPLKIKDFQETSLYTLRRIDERNFKEVR